MNKTFTITTLFAIANKVVIYFFKVSNKWYGFNQFQRKTQIFWSGCEGLLGNPFKDCLNRHVFFAKKILQLLSKSASIYGP